MQVTFDVGMGCSLQWERPTFLRGRQLKKSILVTPGNNKPLNTPQTRLYTRKAVENKIGQRKQCMGSRETGETTSCPLPLFSPSDLRT